MADQVKVQYKYTIIDGKLSFTDALYYDVATYPSIPKATIDAQKQARFDQWKIEIARPKPPIGLDNAVADCQEKIDYYTQQKASFQDQKASAGGGK